MSLLEKGMDGGAGDDAVGRLRGRMKIASLLPLPLQLFLSNGAKEKGGKSCSKRGEGAEKQLSEVWRSTR